MGSKKRESSSKQESALENGEDKQKLNVISENADVEPSKKRMKKEKKKKDIELPEVENVNDAHATPASSNAHRAPLNSRERKKHRKLKDKVRHSGEGQKIDSGAEKMEVESKNDGNESGGTSSSGGGLLPKFHIGVFKELAAVDASVREAAAKTLAVELRQVQNAYDKLENKDEVEDKSKLEAEKDDGLNNCAPSVRYAVRRLIRGVSSSRECARQGFALGLTMLVATVRSIKLESLLKLITSLLEVSSSMKGQEVKDCLLGRLFAYGALARSGKLTEEWKSDNNCVLIKEFTKCLIDLAAKKRYLQEPAVAILLEIVGKLPEEALLEHILEASGLQEWLEGATEAGNPDALLLALKIQEKVSIDHKFNKLLPSPFSKSALFAADYLSTISSCLKESTFCQPRVHSVWPVLISYLLPDVIQDADSASGPISSKKHKKSRKSSSADEDMEKNLVSFCEIIIQGSLLTSSHDRKKLALDVLLLLLPNLPATYVHVILSYKVVQGLVDILSTKDSLLYKVAQHFLKELSEWVVHDDMRRVEVIMALQKHSNGKFDCITRSKTVKDLMSDFKTESGCILFIESLITMFLDEGQSSEEPSDQIQTTDDNSEIGSIEDKDAAGTLGTAEFLKSWVVESLPAVQKHLKLEQDAAKFRVEKEVLKFLAVQGLFSSSLGTEVTSFELQETFRWPKSAIPSALSHMCIEQLQLLLSNAQKGEGPHAVASGVEAKDLGSYFMRFLGILYNIPSVSLSRALNSDDEKAFKKLQAMESQLSKEECKCSTTSDASKIHALRYLLIQLLLQIILRPGEFFEAASEVVMCCKKAFASSDLESSGEDEPEEDGAPELMDVLVDTMLSLLPQSSAPLRSAIEQVFKCFCKDITDDGLHRMLRVVKKDLKPARHHNSDSDDDDAEDDLLGLEEAEESDEAETGETADSDQQTDESEAVVGVDAVTAELPDASDDESDEGMDDDAMFRMDTYLARIFREKKNQAGGETAHSQLVLFKLRVLSLLELYLHENPGKPQVIKIFSNLAQAFINPQTTEGSEQLGQRIWGIIQKKILKAKEYPKGETVSVAILEPLLEKYLKLAAKPFKRKKSASNPSKKKQSASWSRHRLINSLARSSTFWILKIIDASNFSEFELQKVCDILQHILVDYFDSKKSQMKCEFLKEIFRRRPWIGKQLFGFLLEKCSCAKSQFRQVEALDLVTEVLKSHSSATEKTSEQFLKSHVPKLSNLIKHLVTNMPDKQARRAGVRKFCGKVFQMLATFKLSSSFVDALEEDGCAACQSQLGDTYLALKKQV
ncbi:myb-binding protein 1A-like protein [Salvia splendens]|uniref:myb-binding protein 1A-like protein n=1 Tax=Salvia splendens TaxID=180675 RepID=UPI001C268E39|nr:myb-binding protein 1A-like protein [Salvia splendens]XP_042007070.1 myb-binding protein 1A-like protein [Salvia splendens]